MLKVTLLAAALAAAGATAASAQDWRAQSNGWGYGPRGGYDNDIGSSALGRNCPPGYYPHSFPNGNGIRCEPPDDSRTFGPSY
jgi:hypothetical protein